MAVKKNRDEAEKLMRKYPDRIPIIVSKNPNSTTTPFFILRISNNFSIIPSSPVWVKMFLANCKK